MIFYFSGTGNSYAVANQIAKHIEGEQAIPLAGFKDFEQCETAKRIGLVFPCYGASAPDIVLDFKNELFRHIDKKGKYIFAVVTYAHSPAGSYLAFREDVDAWLKVKMPENDIYGAAAPAPGKEKAILADSVIAVNHFIEVILNKKKVVMFRPIPGIRFLSEQGYKLVKNMHKDMAKKLYADQKCIKCGHCIKYCPVHNIMFDDRPVWGPECVNCFGCVNRCPKEAIQAGKKTQGKRRYVHPDYNICY